MDTFYSNKIIPINGNHTFTNKDKKKIMENITKNYNVFVFKVKYENILANSQEDVEKYEAMKEKIMIIDEAINYIGDVEGKILRAILDNQEKKIKNELCYSCSSYSILRSRAIQMLIDYVF